MSLVLIVQATAEDAHNVNYKLLHKPRLRRGDAFLQGPAVEWAPGSRFSEPNNAIRAPPPPAAVARRRKEGAVGRSLTPGSTHGAVRGPSDGRG